MITSPQNDTDKIIDGIAAIDPELVNLLEGARRSLKSGNPDIQPLFRCK